MFNKAYYTQHLQPKKRNKSVTCIIGATCAEGVVIVSDSRITRDYEATNESKIRLFWTERIITAGAGTNAVFDYVSETIDRTSQENPEMHTFNEAARKIEDSIVSTKSRYLPRMGEFFEIELLAAGLDHLDTGEPCIKRINAQGYSENVSKFAIIGHGTPYAISLFGLMYNQMLTIREVALLGSFVISSVVGLGYDQTIGVGQLGPEAIAIRPDEKPAFMNTMESDFKRANEIAKSLKYKNRLVKSIWDVVPQAYSSEDTA